jgi:hypothetical protein
MAGLQPECTNMEWNYPVLKVDESFQKQIPAFKQAVPGMDPRYFGLNARFKTLGQVSSPELVDTLGIYEEGDGWVITVIKATIHNSTQYLFLPFCSAAPELPSGEAQTPMFGKAAFGFETESPRYGKRHWQMVDAFTDYKFFPKLINLFLPREGVSQEHVNAYTTVYESGIGKFIFQTKHKQKIPSLRRWKYRFEGSRFSIKGDHFHLDVYQTLPTRIDPKAMETSPDIIGWISYSGAESLQLLIGVLRRSSWLDIYSSK